MRKDDMIRMRAERDADGSLKVTESTVRYAFNKWRQAQSDFEKMRDYYLGNQKIKSRADGARLCTNMCRYTADSIVGYIAGKPPAYITGDSEDAQRIAELLRREGGTEKDKETLRAMSIFGKAYRLVYHNDDMTPKSTVLDPTQAFVVYTGTVEPESLFGCTVYSQVNDKGITDYSISVYTATEVQQWVSFTQGSSTGWKPVGEPTPHRFGRVPLVEFRNPSGLGDFESIIELQDAYNSLMSDRQDDKDSFASAMLYVQGMIIGATPEEMEEGKTFLKNHRIIQLDENSSIGYLTKTLNESDTQVYADAIMRDIHKTARVPDLSDESFASNSSGVAMAYKLYGTDILAGDKEASFRKSFRYMVKAYYSALHNPLGIESPEIPDEAVDVDIRFTHSIPNDLTYEAGALVQFASSGIVSKETLMEHCSLVDDVALEKERLANDTEELLNREKALYSDEFARME